MRNHSLISTPLCFVRVWYFLIPYIICSFCTSGNLSGCLHNRIFFSVTDQDHLCAVSSSKFSNNENSLYEHLPQHISTYQTTAYMSCAHNDPMTAAIGSSKRPHMALHVCFCSTRGLPWLSALSISPQASVACRVRGKFIVSVHHRANWTDWSHTIVTVSTEKNVDVQNSTVNTRNTRVWTVQ